jgi:hypothetical protein
VVLEAVGMHWMATAVIFGHGTGELIDFGSNELGRFSAIYPTQGLTGHAQTDCH